MNSRLPHTKSPAGDSRARPRWETSFAQARFQPPGAARRYSVCDLIEEEIPPKRPANEFAPAPHQVPRRGLQSTSEMGDFVRAGAVSTAGRGAPIFRMRS